jgi:uncharacterized protein YukE
MAVYEFPSLGFDPAPGDAHELERVQFEAVNHASSLAETARQLSQLDASSWRGRAAQAFEVEAKRLPDDLDRAARAYSEVAAALRAYSAELEAGRAAALRLEQLAAEAKQAGGDDYLRILTVPLKHAPAAAGRWAKFAEGVDPHGAIAEALRSEDAVFSRNGDLDTSFRVQADLGRVIGTKGETSVRVVLDFTGKIWTSFPVR